DDQRPPVAHPDILQQEERGKGAQHVLGAMGEVDDVEDAEDDGEPEAEQRVERAVDQPDQELSEQGLQADSKDLGHPAPSARNDSRFSPARSQLGQLLTNEHPPSASGRNASAAGMVARSL